MEGNGVNMVRINLIEPSKLSDQHLIAEYREILLLFGYYRKHHTIRPSDDHKQPMRFYQDKILYLITRFFEIKEDLIKRFGNFIFDLNIAIYSKFFIYKRTYLSDRKKGDEEIKVMFSSDKADFDDKDIQIIFRNKEIEYKCSYCNNKAEAICPFCTDPDDGLLCGECIENHTCIQDEGEDILLPLVNSPRAGVCGYAGYEDKEVKKYFPKEII